MDPNIHIANILEIYDTFKHNGVTDDVIHLRLFPFSLKDKAKASINGLGAISKSMVNVALGEALMSKTYEAAYVLL